MCCYLATAGSILPSSMAKEGWRYSHTVSGYCVCGPFPYSCVGKFRSVYMSGRGGGDVVRTMVFFILIQFMIILLEVLLQQHQSIINVEHLVTVGKWVNSPVCWAE